MRVSVLHLRIRPEVHVDSQISSVYDDHGGARERCRGFIRVAQTSRDRTLREALSGALKRNCNGWASVGHPPDQFADSEMGRTHK